MASDHMMRASDQDREAVVAALRDAYTAGRLTLEEFDERTTAAYAGRTWGELRKLTEDLPAQPVLGSDVPGRRWPASALPAHPPRADGPLPPARHRNRPAALFPILVLWLVLALAARSAHDVAAPTLVLAVALVFASLSRRRLSGRAPGGPPLQ